MEAAPPNPVKRPLTLSDGFREEGEGAADKRSRRMPERSAEPAEGAMNSNPGALRLLPRRDAVRVLAEPALGVGDSPSRESPPESHALSRFASDTALQLQLRVSIDRTLARICASPSLVAPLRQHHERFHTAKAAAHRAQDVCRELVAANQRLRRELEALDAAFSHAEEMNAGVGSHRMAPRTPASTPVTGPPRRTRSVLSDASELEGTASSSSDAVCVFSSALPRVEDPGTTDPVSLASSPTSPPPATALPWPSDAISDDRSPNTMASSPALSVPSEGEPSTLPSSSSSSSSSSSPSSSTPPTFGSTAPVTPEGGTVRWAQTPRLSGVAPVARPSPFTLPRPGTRRP